VKENILDDDTYQYLFSVEEVNKKVQEGVPFRDAYREVASDIDKGRYRPGRDHAYTHLGSIGNPGLKEIGAKLDRVYGSFRFVRMEELVDALIIYFGKS
jgi:argininosuccinate lyase